MNRQRMNFFAEETLDANKAAQSLPFQDKFVTWTEEENEELTAEQKILVECKLNGATYQTIRQYFKLTSDNTIVAAPKKTAIGYK